MGSGALALTAWCAGLLGAPAVLAHEATDAVRLGDAARAAAVADRSPASIGRFSRPFVERTINGKKTGAKCITDRDGVMVCKPAAGSVTALPDGRVLYWNALEGTERGHWGQFGSLGVNDQSRVLDLRSNPFAWSTPSPVDGGANPKGVDHTGEQLVPGTNDSHANDGALFCSDFNMLPDGRVLAVGGTAWYAEPNSAAGGPPDAEGLRNARIYDPRTNKWSQAAPMTYARWYPTLVSLGDGRQFVASGVTKLVKPVYPRHPKDSGSNVKQTETYDPATGRWSDNTKTYDPATGRGSDNPEGARSLPLYPRLHLLPNGHVFYNAAGQAFNPFGGSYDEALWNDAATYDPRTQNWTTLGVPGAEGGEDNGPKPGDYGDPVRDLKGFGIPGGGTAFTIPGFRGSTFSVMLPLRPDEDGRYKTARYLTGGGVVYPPSPGTYFATSDSRITSVDVSGDRPVMQTTATGDMTRPRWYSSGVLLPSGDVLALSGSDRDHVASPGFEFPIKQAELFDQRSRTWRPVATSDRPRTYHNTAALLPDGRVLVGGHAPLPTAYVTHTQVPGAAPNDGRDPSFELYEPPYLFRGKRPAIRSVIERPRYGQVFGVRLSRPVARSVHSVVLVRNLSTTHLVDADQRSVELRILGRKGNLLRVAAPPGGNVAPPGPYMLFVNRDTTRGPLPSTAAQLMLGQADAGVSRRARITPAP